MYKLILRKITYWTLQATEEPLIQCGTPLLPTVPDAHYLQICQRKKYLKTPDPDHTYLWAIHINAFDSTTSLAEHACFLPSYRLSHFWCLPIPLVITWTWGDMCQPIVMFPLHLGPQNISRVRVSYHLGLLLFWWCGEHSEIQFQTLSVVLFCYFPKFCLDHLYPTQVKGARALVMLLTGANVHLVYCTARERFLCSWSFLHLR
jgi:hypothetical protein